MARRIPIFLNEQEVPAEVQGGKAMARLYAWPEAGKDPSRNICSVLYNATEMVLTDFREGRALPRHRDPRRSAAEDCDAFVRETFG